MKAKCALLATLLFSAAVIASFPLPMVAQTASALQPLITQPVDTSNTVVLTGNTHPLAQAQFDVGSAPASLPLNRMLLILKRSPQQEAALRQLIDSQQDKSSPTYHQWLTPDQFGQQFGPADQDIQTVAAWLQAQGFSVSNVSRGRTVIEFSGTAGQVQAAFHTAIHGFLVNGAQHWANASDPQIPAALAPVVAGIDSLNNFPKKPMSHFVGTYSATTRKLAATSPQFTFNGGCDQDGNCYALAPYDFATIYNVLPLWNATPTPIDGTGQTIAIVGRSNINIQDVRDFRSLFGLPAKDPQIILNGPDPGLNGDESEQAIDVQWSGAVAKNATIDLVVSESTETTDGIDLSAEYIVDNNLAPVMSASYGLCEQFLGTAGNQFFNALWEQAAAQGITVMVSTGDNGSAGCDFNQGSVPQPARSGLAVNGIASTPFNVAVGGTDFNDFFNPQTYWNLTNDPTTQASAKGYIPEITWDDSCTNFLFAQVGFTSNAETNCNNSQLLGGVLTVGGSGGVSTSYSKPAWQTGAGVPADGKRDLPDVSLFSGDGFLGNFYVICESDLVGSCSLSTFAGFGGTSVASPAFAGIMALVNQKTGARQGNPNYVLYKLAATQSAASCNSSNVSGATCIFNDVTQGTIAMPCATGSPNCTTNTAGHQFGVLSGYGTTTAYDRATGLGSVNANNLVTKWNTITFRPSTTALSLSPTTGLTHGQAVTVNVTVAPGSGTGTPTGNVSLLTSTGQGVGGFTLSSGKFSGTTNVLPGGNYTVTANYGGDGIFGGSASSPPVSMTINPENSKTSTRLVTFDNSGNLISSNATTAVYGSPYLLRVDVMNSAGIVCGPLGGCPTGNVALTDNGAPLDLGTFALNSQGYFEDQLVQLPGGSHTVQAQYAGDSSFNASTGNAVFTITPAATSMRLPSLITPTTVGVGDPVSVTVQTQSSGIAPTGTITFFDNGTAIAGPVFLSGTNGSVSGFATLTGSSSVTPATPGNHIITGTYSGDPNYSGSSSPPVTVVAKYQPSITLTTSPQNPAPGTTVTVTATVDAGVANLPPTGNISFTGNPVPISASVPLTTAAGSNGNSAGQASTTLTATASLAVAAQYGGDANYFAISSLPGTTITVPGTDFALYTAPDNIAIAAGNLSSIVVNVAGQASYNGTVAFSPGSCSGLPAEATCSFNPPSLTGTGSSSLAIGTTGPHTIARNSSSPEGPGWWGTTLGMGLAGVLFLGSTNRRRWSGLLSLIVLGVLLVTPGCGGGAGGGGGHLDPGTPKGTYSVTVTGSDGTATHTTTFTLTVQ